MIESPNSILICVAQVGLDEVDITVPLRPDEVIPVQKHRSSDIPRGDERDHRSRSAEGSSGGHREKKTKRNSKNEDRGSEIADDSNRRQRTADDKKERKKSSRHKTSSGKESNSSAGNVTSSDLLGLDYAPVPSVQAMLPPSSSAYSDSVGRSGGGGGGHFDLIAPNATHGNNVTATDDKPEKRSSKRSLRLWSVAETRSVPNIVILYSFENGNAQQGTVDIYFHVISTIAASTGSTISVGLDFGDSAAVAHYKGPRSRGAIGREIPCIADSIKAGTSTVTSRLGLRLNSRRPGEESMDLTCEFKFTIESLIGSPDVSIVKSRLNLPTACFLQPLEATEDFFETMLSDSGRSSNRYCGAASERISIDTGFLDQSISSKYALKAISKAVNGFIVEKEVSKAASICCRAGNGTVCCLAKVVSQRDRDERSVAIMFDVKFLSSDASVDVNAKARSIAASFRSSVLL